MRNIDFEPAAELLMFTALAILLGTIIGAIIHG